MTASFDQSLGTPPLSEAIDRRPLIVGPATCLLDVVKLMHETAQHSYRSPEALQARSADSLWGARASCVLVMQAGDLLGIFTERDLVQLSAAGANLLETRIAEVMHHPVLTMFEQALHNVFAALFLFRRHRIRHLVIIDEQQQVVGVVSLDSIRHILRPTNLLKIRRVAEVMTHQVTTAFPETSVAALTEVMASRQISCIVIVEPADRIDLDPTQFDRAEFDRAKLNESESVQRPVGIITERDIVRFQALGLNFHTTLAQSVMSTPLLVLSPEDSLWTAHQAMEQRQVRRLVVSWNWGEKLGIVTQTSILRVFDPIEMHGVIETLQRTIQQMGLDLDKVLATAIDPDTHLAAALPSAEAEEIPNLKAFFTELQQQIHYLLDRPHLSIEMRQATLQAMLVDLQQFQNLL